MEISAKYLMELAQKVEVKIWAEYETYKKVQQYIDLHHWCNKEYNSSYEESFAIAYKDDKQEQIDLNTTLHNIKKGCPEILLKMAIELGIETPNFIPSIPVFQNTLKVNYNTAFDAFNQSIKQIEEHPDTAIGLANSALESIIKHILSDQSVSVELEKIKTKALSSLIDTLLKELKFFSKEIPDEIRNIGSGLSSVSKNIDDLRSRKTHFHGKTKDDYVVDDPLYAYFIVNAVSTVGLFLISFYEKKYKVRVAEKAKEVTSNIPSEITYESEIRPEDLPF